MYYLFLLSLIFKIFFFSINVSVAIENRILLKINNQIITTVDINTEIKYLKIINEDFNKLNNSQIIEISKKSLIREIIKTIELKDKMKELELDDDILNSVLLDYFGKFGVNSVNNLNNFFLEKNIDFNLIKRKVTVEILWNQYIYAKFINKVKINQDKIRKELTNNNFQREFELSEILFNLNTEEKLEEKFILIKKDIDKNGFSQAALAHSLSKTSSNGGNLGWINETVLSTKIKEKIQTTLVGNYTNPIVTPGGFLIIKVGNIRKVKKDLDLNDQLEIIVKKKTNQQLNQYSNVYFNKVKKNIVINEL
tara:strand:- start:920 stop:1846 length:927 start_codon:yes stop_codon:yes gene_type:complete